MDTLRDKHELEKAIETGNAPWMLWNKDSKSKNGHHHKEFKLA
jgi:hypothetical protein